MSDQAADRVSLDGISKSYALEGTRSLEVLDGVSFDVRDDEFFTLVGPSGCGKSTLLNVIVGWTDPDTGTVAIEPSRSDVRIAFVFQDPTLLDWRTVRENLRFALRGFSVPTEEHDGRIQNALELVGLSEFADQYPSSLSGGMQQRVGFARALCVDPDVLLMDEPFSSLDELTARALRRRILDIWHEKGFTAVLVTHDINEAVYLSDRIVVLSDTPTQVTDTIAIEIDRPRNPEGRAIREYEGIVLDALGVST